MLIFLILTKVVKISKNQQKVIDKINEKMIFRLKIKIT